MAQLPVVREGAVLIEWIQFDEDTEVGVEFLDRPEFKDEIKKAEKIAKRTGAAVNDILNPRLAKRCIKGWRKIGNPAATGFMDGDNPFPFSEENLMFLVKNSYGFNAFLSEYVANEQFYLQLAREREVKNSKGSPVTDTEGASR